MISIAQLDTIEKTKNAATENGVAELFVGDFAALLSAPVEQSRNSAAHNTNPDEKALPGDADEATEILFDPSAQVVTSNNILQNFQIQSAKDSTGEITEALADFKSLFASGKNDFQKQHSVQTSTEIVSAEAVSIIKTGLESGKIEILNASENIQTPGSRQTDGSETLMPPANEKSESLNDFSALFSSVSNVLKQEDSVNSKQNNSVAGFVFENNFADEFQRIAQSNSNAASNESAIDFKQPEIETRKTEKQLKASEDFSVISFEKILSSVSKEKKLIENSPPSAIDRTGGEVFEQIEAQTLQLLNLKTNEKKVLKMRLHPAELGMVEIKLEKDASGKLHAHFQTENETTRQILTGSLDQLRDSLENSGWQIERLEISCSPFSSSEHGNRDGNQSRQIETVEEQRPTAAAASDTPSDSKDDLKSNPSNRLLSVRA